MRKKTDCNKISLVILPITVLVLAGISGCTVNLSEGNGSEKTVIQTEESGVNGTDVSESDDTTSSAKPDFEAMSTKELLAVCLESQRYNQLGYSSDFSQEFKALMARSKKYQILYDREDAPEVFMEEIRNQLTTEVQTESDINSGAREYFMFLIMHHLYLDGRISKEEFKEAERFFWECSNERIAANGGETVPYDPNLDIVYYGDVEATLTVDDLIVGSINPENIDLTRHYMVSEPFSIQNSSTPNHVVYFVFCDGKCIGELTTRIIQSKYFGEASFFQEKCEEITVLYEAGAPISVISFGEKCWGIVSGEEIYCLYGNEQFDENINTVSDVEEEQIILRDLDPKWMKLN
ncbi:MAG: hypothetical protein J5825_08355 [Lachnospiraceae bacterium]|nr:hypothetical protein [Lachnospiraceae bacterium]